MITDALTLLNVAICVVILCICFERVRITSYLTHWSVRWGFSLMAMCSVLWAVSPVFWPDVTPWLRVSFSAAILLHLLSETPLWKDGAPRELHHGSERRTKDRRI